MVKQQCNISLEMRMNEMKIIFMGRKKYFADLVEWTVNQGIDVEAVVTDSHLINSPTTKKLMN